MDQDQIAYGDSLVAFNKQVVAQTTCRTEGACVCVLPSHESVVDVIKSVILATKKPRVQLVTQEAQSIERALGLQIARHPRAQVSNETGDFWKRQVLWGAISVCPDQLLVESLNRSLFVLTCADLIVFDFCSGAARRPYFGILLDSLLQIPESSRPSIVGLVCMGDLMNRSIMFSSEVWEVLKPGTVFSQVRAIHEPYKYSEDKIKYRTLLWELKNQPSQAPFLSKIEPLVHELRAALMTLPHGLFGVVLVKSQSSSSILVDVLGGHPLLCDFVSVKELSTIGPGQITSKHLFISTVDFSCSMNMSLIDFLVWFDFSDSTFIIESRRSIHSSSGMARICVEICDGVCTYRAYNSTLQWPVGEIPHNENSSLPALSTVDSREQTLLPTNTHVEPSSPAVTTQSCETNTSTRKEIETDTNNRSTLDTDNNLNHISSNLTPEVSGNSYAPTKDTSDMNPDENHTVPNMMPTPCSNPNDAVLRKDTTNSPPSPSMLSNSITSASGVTEHVLDSLTSTRFPISPLPTMVQSQSTTPPRFKVGTHTEIVPTKIVADCLAVPFTQSEDSKCYRTFIPLKPSAMTFQVHIKSDTVLAFQIRPHAVEDLTPEQFEASKVLQGHLYKVIFHAGKKVFDWSNSTKRKKYLVLPLTTQSSTSDKIQIDWKSIFQISAFVAKAQDFRKLSDQHALEPPKTHPEELLKTINFSRTNGPNPTVLWTIYNDSPLYIPQRITEDTPLSPFPNPAEFETYSKFYQCHWHLDVSPEQHLLQCRIFRTARERLDYDYSESRLKPAGEKNRAVGVQTISTPTAPARHSQAITPQKPTSYPLLCTAPARNPNDVHSINEEALAIGFVMGFIVGFACNFSNGNLVKPLCATPVQVDCAQPSPVVNSTSDKIPLLVPELCRAYPLSFEVIKASLMLPAVLQRIEKVALVAEIPTIIPTLQMSSTSSLLAATTAMTAIDPENYETLEKLGDSVLKIIATVHVFCIHPATANEGDLTNARASLIRNDFLQELMERSLLLPHTFTVPQPWSTWTPPGLTLPIFKKRSVPNKVLADIVEALTATVWLAKEPERSFVESCAFLASMGAPFNAWQSYHPPDPISRPLEASHIQKIEALLQYEFKNKIWISQALTDSDSILDNYERLEFLGDAILDIIIVDYLHSKYPTQPPGVLTKLHGTCACNETFAMLCEKSHLSTFIIPATDAGHTKADVFEAIAGAVFLDTTFSYDLTRKVFFPLLRDFLDAQRNPISDVEVLLQEKCPNDPRPFRFKNLGDQWVCDVMLHGKVLATAKAYFKHNAKAEAALLALPLLLQPNPNTTSPGSADSQTKESEEALESLPKKRRVVGA
ncbi:Endoribonuclease Dicer [Pelomyxa schiedti]|nr:Endoribonuclease Dicer [Pelomyxa schiedti]